MKINIYKILVIIISFLMPVCLQAQWGSRYGESSDNSSTIIWIVLIIIFQAAVCGGLASNVAGKKGQSQGTWFAAGFFFSIFGLIAAAGLPVKQLLSQEAVKKCPDCAEDVNKESIICKYCGYRFSKEDIIKEMVALLSDKKASNRVYAIEQLRLMRDKSAIPHLIKAVDAATVHFSNHSDFVPILDKSAQALVEIGDATIIPQLEVILEKSANSSSKLNRIMEILGSYGGPAVPTLIKSLKNRNIKDYAVKTLCKIGKHANPYLEKAMDEGDSSTRKTIENILRTIQSQ